jgi:UDP-N-acetylmuramate: L-alanyl-gamma-D-glutamyl-meso-diaminopimelate ligase
MELVGSVRVAGGEVRVYDDFAHHPTAIRTTVDGLRRSIDRQALKGGAAGRVLAIFEPRSNTMKLGTMKAQLPWALEGADLAFCHSGGLDWDAADALKLLGNRASVHPTVDELVQAVVRLARPGDHLLCMSNGGFGGVHAKLIQALEQVPG